MEWGSTRPGKENLTCFGKKVKIALFLPLLGRRTEKQMKWSELLLKTHWKGLWGIFADKWKITGSAFHQAREIPLIWLSSEKEESSENSSSTLTGTWQQRKTSCSFAWTIFTWVRKPGHINPYRPTLRDVFIYMHIWIGVPWYIGRVWFLLWPGFFQDHCWKIFHVCFANCP